MNQFTLLLNSALKQTRCWIHSNSQLKFILIIVSWGSSRKRPSLNIVVACCKNHPHNRPAPVTDTFFASPGFPLTRASFDCIFLQIYIGSLNFEPKWKYIRSRVTTDGRKISRQCINFTEIKLMQLYHKLVRPWCNFCPLFSFSVEKSDLYLFKRTSFKCFDSCEWIRWKRLPKSHTAGLNLHAKWASVSWNRMYVVSWLSKQGENSVRI